MMNRIENTVFFVHARNARRSSGRREKISRNFSKSVAIATHRAFTRVRSRIVHVCETCRARHADRCSRSRFGYDSRDEARENNARFECARARIRQARRTSHHGLARGDNAHRRHQRSKRSTVIHLVNRETSRRPIGPLSAPCGARTRERWPATEEVRCFVNDRMGAIAIGIPVKNWAISVG